MQAATSSPLGRPQRAFYFLPLSRTILNTAIRVLLFTQGQVEQCHPHNQSLKPSLASLYIWNKMQNALTANKQGPACWGRCSALHRHLVPAARYAPASLAFFHLFVLTAPPPCQPRCTCCAPSPFRPSGLSFNVASSWRCSLTPALQLPKPGISHTFSQHPFSLKHRPSLYSCLFWGHVFITPHLQAIVPGGWEKPFMFTHKCIPRSQPSVWP